MSENSVSHTTPPRKQWEAPVLEQLTVDLDAIAAKTLPGNDGTGGHTRS
ncbi:MAG: hypothetical protein KDE63_03330 [Novosphingobium sp.]|nr:hypothetical protein [Novosphingobium sp.]